SRCCRYVLEINFNLMGWSWVIAPTVYQTFYCAGDCPEMNIYAFSGSRDNRMYSFVRRNEDASCCSATKHSDLSILYQNEKGDILHEVVPNMVLEQCGCS
ncbi:hypothetical protein HELRODRAFT_137287, partial [Helobdella robusta]|uniref:TGF-beta family profile domain-containing protein n=1 Tax=Helobdella robusta TaxID=6412 RepID=T1EII9_HELRO